MAYRIKPEIRVDLDGELDGEKYTVAHYFNREKFEGFLFGELMGRYHDFVSVAEAVKSGGAESAVKIPEMFGMITRIWTECIVRAEGYQVDDGDGDKTPNILAGPSVKWVPLVHRIRTTMSLIVNESNALKEFQDAFPKNESGHSSPPASS